jgi:hypothetical protein
MTQRRASQLTIAYDPEWKRQSGWNSPIPGSELTRAFPATSRNYIQLDETVEDIVDCTGEDLLMELLTGGFARLNIDFDLDPDIFAGVAAFAYGSAAAPTGGTSEVQTETVTALSGTRRLTIMTGANSQTTDELAYNATDTTIQTALEALSNVGAGDIIVTNPGAANEVQTETIDGDVDGGTRTLSVEGQETAPIAWNADAATIQAALEALSNVAPGDITVAGAGPYTYTFGGTMARSNRALIVVNPAGLTAGGGAPAAPPASAIVQTTPGSAGTLVYTFASNFANRNVNTIGIDTFGLVDGTASIVTTTPGVGLTHGISRITGYSLPLMTLYLGYRGSDKQPVIFKNVVVNSFRVRSANRERVTVNVELIGSAHLEQAVGFTMPECQDLIPIRFGECKMLINGVDYIAEEKGREFEYYYQNDVTPRFDGAGVYSTRHERADVRPSGLNFWILGEPYDDLFNMALLRNKYPMALQLGPDGRNVLCEAPQAIVKMTPDQIRHGGDPPESEIEIVGRPTKVSGDAPTPSTITATVAQTTAFLTSA